MFILLFLLTCFLCVYEDNQSTTLYQSAPLADWFFIFLEFFSQIINAFIVLQRKGTIFHILKLCNPNLSAHKSFKPLFI